ncbi:alpha/beta hydrolase family protein [Lignipirellula cremea]|uniref:Acetyl xylan esterase (AXE1) n=1 Tax=Lignipirellula cremea TaxID=2528010 RepID=A0A518DYX5_9BACT|nr:dienelactone hydrolase family protein [Lignipirellula cremea]QDU97001.1 Acetyl xylan esterase (AXE1) [Lignipirellula cremea]
MTASLISMPGNPAGSSGQYPASLAPGGRRLPAVVALVLLGAMLGPATFLQTSVLQADDTLVPLTSDEVPDNVADLWKSFDPRKDALETEVVQEWQEEGVVCRYVVFKVGVFRGVESRIAGLYTFPAGMKQGPAFVWSHGGGQRAERERGLYFAKQGYATLDLNWGGREIVAGIQSNTDWGKVDPSQGPRFYPKALRKGTKLDLSPDDHTLDPVVSPRNGNWFLLALAGRRGITFLERQPEVDPEKIGFTGYSMGGVITSMAAIDERLKAVAPMVGGSGFILSDFAGLPGSGKARSFPSGELYSRTIDSHAYWPLVKCPVLFLSASNDFHAVFENVYRSAVLLPHNEWRVSQKMHTSHSLGAEQWILLNRWFDRYLKGETVDIPLTPTSVLEVDAEHGTAIFSVTPDQRDKVTAIDVYYSHDPNPRARFWKHAPIVEANGVWTAPLTARPYLPLYVFANCTYALPGQQQSFQGMARAITITSVERAWLPEEIRPELLAAHTGEVAPVFEDFLTNGLRDWGTRPQGGIATYKFQDPDLALPPASRKLSIGLNAPTPGLSVRLRITKNQWLTGAKGPKEEFSASKRLAAAGPQQVLLGVSDFINAEGEPMTDWEDVSVFTLSIYNPVDKASLDFTEPENGTIFGRLEWRDEREDREE